MYRERWAGADELDGPAAPDPTGLQNTIDLLERAVNAANNEQWDDDGEVCFVQTDEQICGPMSFDSTDDLACIEIYQDGELRWVCGQP
jgi:hypothetical protein